MMDYERLTILSIKYISGTISPEEEEELSVFLDVPGNRERFDEMVSREAVDQDTAHWNEAEARVAGSLRKVGAKLEGLKRPPLVVSLRRWGLAAAVAAGVVLCYFAYQDYRAGSPGVAVAKPADLMPGAQRATLTLSSGRKIVLDGEKRGAIGTDAGAKIEKVDSGVIKYLVTNGSENSSKTTEETPEFNTLRVPKGGTYAIVLPDRSIVYLNSASSLKYPTKFNPENPRLVELTGEAFFMVAPDPSRPFRVLVNGKSVDVLGTEFNINAYEDEPDIKTTLMQGLVKVVNDDRSVLLRPGQQAIINNKALRVVSEVDTDAVVAWKNGEFRWTGVTIETVMRQLSRWYNVEVVYNGVAPTQRCVAAVSRNRPASEVLKALELTGYHFKIVGPDKIEVSP